MKKSALALSAALCLSASLAHAGPKSFIPAEGGTTTDGREYDAKIVSCSGSSEEHELRYFKDNRKWCLEDESYCSRHIIKAGKKACRQ